MFTQHPVNVVAAFTECHNSIYRVLCEHQVPYVGSSAFKTIPLPIFHFNPSPHSLFSEFSRVLHLFRLIISKLSQFLWIKTHSFFISKGFFSQRFFCSQEILIFPTFISIYIKQSEVRVPDHFVNEKGRKSTSFQSLLTRCLCVITINTSPPSPFGFHLYVGLSKGCWRDSRLRFM